MPSVISFDNKRVKVECTGFILAHSLKVIATSGDGLFNDATRIDCYNHSFFPSAVRVWNGIPGIVALSSTIDSFKAAVGTLGLGKA